MKNKYTSMFGMVVAGLTLLLARVDVAFGLAAGDEVNVQFAETNPASNPGFANGTLTLGAAVAGKPGVFHVATFAVTVVDPVCSGCAIVYNPTHLLFNANTPLLSGSATGVYIATGDGAHSNVLTLPTSGANWNALDKKISNGAKQTYEGTYTISAVPTVSVYDDFTNPLIDPDKWIGSEFTGGEGNIAEAARLIQSGALRLFSRIYGGTDSDAGSSFGAFRLAFPDPNSIHAIRARVQVMGFESVGCAGTSASTDVRAVIGGFFFNTGTATPGDATGDVHAQISIDRASNSTDKHTVLQISGEVVQCTNSSCLTATQLGTSPVNLGKVGVGVPVRLFIAWDQANHQFLFQSGTNAMVPLAYGVSDSSPPAIAFKRLDSNAFVANCTTTPRPHAVMDVRFDHVEVDAP